MRRSFYYSSYLWFGAMPTTEETFVDPIVAVDPSGGADEVDSTVTPPLSLCTMM